MYSVSNPLQMVACADKPAESRRWIRLATKQLTGVLAGCTLQLEEANSFGNGWRGGTAMQPRFHLRSALLGLIVLLSTLPHGRAAGADVVCDNVAGGSLRVLTINLLFSEIENRNTRLARIADFVAPPGEPPGADIISCRRSWAGSSFAPAAARGTSSGCSRIATWNSRRAALTSSPCPGCSPWEMLP